MTTWAVVPVKAFERAKSRLERVLGRPGCEALARAMFDHVFGVLSVAAGIDGVLVVSDSRAVLETARQRGAAGISDRAGVPLGRVVDEALRHVPASRAVVTMSDLPLLGGGDVERLLSKPGRVVIAPDRRGQGTNALVVELPAPWPTCFGTPDSALRHRALEPGAEIVVTPGLAYDVDEAPDLVLWPGRAGDLIAAPRARSGV